MATSAPARRLAHAVVALAVAGPAMLLGGVAWAADPTPAPADQPAVEAPVVQPSIGTWIIGGTELEGTAGTPAKPVAKPAAKPAAGAPARAATRPAVRTTRTSGISPRTVSHRSTTTQGAPGGATALPFTGNHVDALLPTGIALLVGGVALVLAGRPRRLAA